MELHEIFTEQSVSIGNILALYQDFKNEMSYLDYWKK